jgi:VWFA-related protein
VICFLAAFALLGQLPEPIRVTTQMVEVNVVVRDKNGPVVGLGQNDFILRDRGRLQKIAVFRADSRSTERPEPLEPGEFTNRQGARHAIVIVWDHLNTDFGDAAVARAKVLEALGQIQTQDRVALYTLDSELTVIQDFTSDSSLLVDAMRKYREERLARPVDVPLLSASSAGDSRVAEMFEAVNSARLANAAAYRATVTAAAIRAIANHLAGIQGRKSVLWIASEFPAAAAGLASAGIAVYPVDLSGTSASSPQVSQVERKIAQQSGGIAFVHSDLRGAIDRAVKDAEFGYTLGFYPDRAPDPMNALRIEVKRKGVDVGHRSAYSGIPKADTPRAAEIAGALASPLDATQISLNVHLSKQAAGWNIALELDPAEIMLEHANSRWTGGLDIALRQMTTEGLVLITTMTTAGLEFNEARYRVFMNKKHVVNLTIPDPSPSLATLRLVVADRVLGRVGSITIPVR